jgi:hypothetical protein
VTDTSDIQVFLGETFKITVIPGSAERRPGHEVKLFAIHAAAETLWIALKSLTPCPAFAGMTEKT